MKNIWVITVYTLREAMARKVFIFFISISVLVLLLMALIFSMSDTVSILSNMQKGAGDASMGNVINGLELLIVAPLSGLGLLLAIFASASFIPIMLEKGNIDLLLSKPVSRVQLLLGKYLGGLLVVFLNIAFLIIGVWLIISLKFSNWDLNFLTTILTVTFTFAVLYSMIVLFGVLTKSSTFGMMMAYFIFLILSPGLSALNGRLSLLISSEFWRTVIKGFYYIIPNTSELMGSTTIGLATGRGIESYSPILTSFLFLLVMIGASLWVFNKKDF